MPHELTVQINLDNAAFSNPSELGRILRNLADKMDDIYRQTTHDGLVGATGTVRDINGNTCGAYAYTTDKEQ